MPGERRGTLLVGLICVLLLFAGSLAAEEAEVRIEIDAEGNVATEDGDGRVVDEDHEPPERYAWQMDLPEDHQLVNVTVAEGFPVEEARQLVPLVDGAHFVQAKDPAGVDRPVNAYNLSTEQDTWRYRLGIPGPAEVNLTLERDLEPPTLEIVSVGNVTHVGFDVATNTSEPALAELVVETPEGEQLQTYPTNRPGPWQLFPVQGLEANTTYVAAVEAWDWSGNRAQRATVEATTGEEPDPPEPLVEPVRPAPNATVGAEGIVIEASVSEQGWPIVEEDVQAFFDKERVEGSIVAVDEGSITFPVEGPLEAREYFVSLEVPNTAGGVGVARWSFHVEDDAARPAPGPGVAVLAATLAGLAAARRG